MQEDLKLDSLAEVANECYQRWMQYPEPREQFKAVWRYISSELKRIIIDNQDGNKIK